MHWLLLYCDVAAAVRNPYYSLTKHEMCADFYAGGCITMVTQHMGLGQLAPLLSWTVILSAEYIHGVI